MNRYKLSSLNGCFIVSLLLYLMLGLAGTAFAGGMKIKAGLWEMKSTVTLPFGNGTQEDVATNCIDQDEITPEEIMQDAQGCQISDAKADSGAMQWNMVCQSQGIEMKGDGFAKSTGETIEGGMNIKFDAGGQELAMTSIYQGKYIGPCE